MQVSVRRGKPQLGKRAIKAALARIETRLFRAREPFGVFVVENAAVMIKVSTRSFELESLRAAQRGPHSHLVGVYDGRASIESVREDLEQFAR